jgi:hypothetical protein
LDKTRYAITVAYVSIGRDYINKFSRLEYKTMGVLFQKFKTSSASNNHKHVALQRHSLDSSGNASLG